MPQAGRDGQVGSPRPIAAFALGDYYNNKERDMIWAGSDKVATAAVRPAGRGMGLAAVGRWARRPGDGLVPGRGLRSQTENVGADVGKERNHQGEPLSFPLEQPQGCGGR